MPSDQFISESLTPDAGSFDAQAMARGEPGLPGGFTWRQKHYVITELLESWKSNAPAGEGSQYLRRHWFKIRTADGQIMTLYCLRNARVGNKRWWLYSIHR